MARRRNVSAFAVRRWERGMEAIPVRVWIELREELRVRKLVVDLTHTEIVDSAGLGVLMHIFGEMEQLGGEMRVAGANQRVAKMFHVTHTDGILVLDPDLMASVKNLKPDSIKN